MKNQVYKYKYLLLTITIFIIATILLSSFNKKKRNNKFVEKQKLTEEKLSLWIKNHALYPETYVPIKFEDFTFSTEENGFTTVENSECYKIMHIHKLKNKDNQIVEFKGYFTLEYDFDLNSVEKEKSNGMCGAFPPQIEIWTELFGKPTTLKDSLKLEKTRKEKMNEAFDMLNEANNSEHINEKDKEQIKDALKALDTLKDK